ncbi:unnamed protein product, partial [marine sediment metagenome]
MGKTLIENKHFTLSTSYGGRSGRHYQITRRYGDPYPDDNTHCHTMGYVILTVNDLWEILQAV